MYNHDQKLRYIKEKEASTVVANDFLLRQFSFSEAYENELNKDISNFTKHEILENYKMINTPTVETLVSINSHLSMYTQWCLQQNLVKDGQNHFLEVDFDDMYNCINKFLFDQKIVARETVLQWCQLLQNPRESFAILCLFEFGKSKNFTEITRMTIDQIHGNEIKLPTRAVHVSSSLIKYAEEAREATVTYPRMDSDAQSRPLIDDGTIMKSIHNARNSDDFYTGRRLYSLIVRIMKMCGAEHVSPNALVNSGILHMIRERAEYHNVTPIEYVKSPLIEEVNYQYNCNIVSSSFIKKYSDYLV